MNSILIRKWFISIHNNQSNKQKVLTKRKSVSSRINWLVLWIKIIKRKWKTRSIRRDVCSTLEVMTAYHNRNLSIFKFVEKKNLSVRPMYLLRDYFLHIQIKSVCVRWCHAIHFISNKIYKYMKHTRAFLICFWTPTKTLIILKFLLM